LIGAKGGKAEGLVEEIGEVCRIHALGYLRILFAMLLTRSARICHYLLVSTMHKESADAKKKMIVPILLILCFAGRWTTGQQSNGGYEYPPLGGRHTNTDSLGLVAFRFRTQFIHK
jgi:hypothetical protein